MEVKPYEKPKTLSIISITKVNKNSKIERNEENSTCKIFIQLFKVGYFLCIVPFSLKFDKGNYVITRNRIQMAACLIISGSTVVLITSALSYAILERMKNLQKDPTNLFRSVETFTFTLLMWIIYKISWTQQKFILKCLNDLEIGNGMDNLPRRKIDQKNILRIIVGLFYLVIRLEHLTNKILRPEFFSEFDRASFEQMFFYLPKSVVEKLESFILMQMLHFSAILSVQLATNYSVLLVFGMIWCYSLICKRFCKDLNAIRDNGEFLRRFMEFQRRVKSLNRAFGTLVLGVTSRFFPMYMIWSIEIFYLQIRTVTFREKLGFATDSVYFVFFYVVAARMYNKVQTTLGRTILEKHAELQMGEKEFMGYLYQIQTTPLGVSGNGIFTISYRSIASIVSLVFTYTIVVVQFNSNTNTNNKNGTT